MKKRNGFTVMMRLIGLVRPLTGYMLIAVVLGVAGFVCSTFLTILGAWSLWNTIINHPEALGGLLVLIAVFGAARGFLRYGEQAWRSFAIKFSARFAAFARQSWTDATKAI